MSRQEFRALRQAQEAIERRGDWTHPAPLTSDDFATEVVILVICLGLAALVYAAATDKLNEAGAQLFSMIGNLHK